MTTFTLYRDAKRTKSKKTGKITGKGEFRWHATRKGQIVASEGSDGYTRRANCLKGLMQLVMDIQECKFKVFQDGKECGFEIPGSNAKPTPW